MKNSLLILLLLSVTISFSQVGINNTDPKALLDITASNIVTPSNSDGILIPRIDAFPTTNPGADQNAMLVYLNATSSSSTPGFYYWNNGITTWTAIGGSTGADTQDLSIDNTVGDISLVDGGIVEIKTIADSDDDTLIQVEESVDEDVIRFDVEGDEQFTMNNRGQLQIYNSGQSVLVGEGAGAAHDNSATRRNTLIGFEAGNDITTAVNNTVIGWRAMDAATNGVDNNVSIGQNTFGSLTTGSANIAIGVGSLSTTTTANNTVAIGLNALSNSVASENNVAIGRSAGANSDGPDNVYIGYQADAFNANAGATQNVIIGSGTGEGTGGGTAYVGRVMLGYQAGRNSGINNSLFIENSSSVTPLIYGEFDNNILRVGGQLQIGSSDDTTSGAIYSFPSVDGTSGQVLTTDGLGVVSWASAATSTDTQDLSIDNTTAEVSLVDGGSVIVSTLADADADTKIQVEESADEDIIRFDLAGTEVVTFQGSTINTINAGSSTFLGNGAGAADDLTDNRTTFIGFEAGGTVTTGIWNTAIGYQALKGNVTGGSNTMVGYQAGFNTTTSDNVGMGRWTLRNNVANALGDGRNVAIGASNSAYSNGTKNVSVGNGAMGVSNSGSQFLEGNVALGSGAGFFLRDAIGNIGIGENAIDFLENGDYNVVIGHDAGRRINNGSENNIMIGREVGGNSALVVDKRTFKNSILLGHNAGYLENEGSEDRLYIEHSGSRTPLIGGDFANDRVGINVDMTTSAPGVGVAPDALTHTLTVGGSVKIDTLMNLKPGTAPATPAEGDVYYDSGLKKVRVWTGAAWENLN